MNADHARELAIQVGIQPPETYHGDATARTPWIASTDDIDALCLLAYAEGRADEREAQAKDAAEFAEIDAADRRFPLE